MDPKTDTAVDRISSRIAGYTLICMVFLLKSVTWMVSWFTYVTTVSDDALGHFTQTIENLVNSQILNDVSDMMLVVAAIIITFGGGYEARQSDRSARDANIRRTSTLPMSELARSAETRLNGLIAQFRSIPKNMLLPEASIEFKRIESSHVPDLQHAHREARTTVQAKPAKSDELDADYALSLARISNSLERLIEDCEALGRERLEAQGRFIEARHPTDLFKRDHDTWLTEE